MANVIIRNIIVLDNPSHFQNPFLFEITFDCIEEYSEYMEWQIIYVGSAWSKDYDQILGTAYVQPVPKGQHVVLFEAEAPDVTKIPEDEIVDKAVVMFTCSYRNQLFVRVGYFVINYYVDPQLEENPPAQLHIDKLARVVLSSDPIVCSFNIDWDDGLSDQYI